MIKNDLAPIAVYTYNRIDTLEKTITSLKNCKESINSDLFIVSDAAYRKEDEELVNRIRDYARNIKGFSSVNLIARNKNLGAFESITKAETQIISDYGRIIGLEDDNIVSPQFLRFINEGLEFYKEHRNVFSICGYCPKLTFPSEYENSHWVSPWHIPWGYGFWKDKYLNFDNRKNLFGLIRKDKEKIKRLKSYGLFSYDSIYLDWKGVAPVFDAKVNAHTFYNDMVSIVPVRSLVNNIGHDGRGENAKPSKHFEVNITNELDFSFIDDTDIDMEILKLYTNFMDKGKANKLIKKAGIRRFYYIMKYLIDK
ncbi:glycosyltransferase [Vibrio parahaemolyticus]|nr:glycosyltransferase [Vibrio parahaemolyticus]